MARGILAGVIVLAMQSQHLAVAQVDAGDSQDPGTHVAWVEAFLEHTDSIEATFQQDYWSRVYARTTTARGRIRIARPGRIRFDYSEPAGQVVVGTSQEIMYYQASDDGRGQYSRVRGEALSSAFAFLMGDVRISERFTSTDCAGRPGLEHTVCIELRPRARERYYLRLRLYVSSLEESRGLIERLSIEDHDGNWNSFTFRDLDVAPTFETGAFDFTPPTGSRELDVRQ